MRHAEAVTFAGGTLDRAAQLRPEAGRLLGEPETLVLPVWRGRPLLGADGALGWVPRDHPLVQGDGVFLGLTPGGGARFAAAVDWDGPGGVEAPPGFADTSLTTHPALPAEAGFADLRGVMGRLGTDDAGVAATAKGLLAWHETHGFCARCGAPTEPADGGWKRACQVCGGQHFPRTDPVVIMLVTRGEEVLLGRAPAWPEGMYSLLAGFMEPGETVEAAVRRETWEEAGVRVGAVRYLASQPWPFPASLMIGCHGDALTREIRRDPAELEDARWVTREGLLAGLTGADPSLRPARKGSIARFLLERWLADSLG